jgi:hypothetical protein
VSDTGLLHTWRYFPVIISGNTASIYLHNQLAYGTTYYVTIDPTVLTDSQGFAGIQDPEAWRFTTRTSPPAAGTSQLTVAGDGSGDFCTVQAAIDFVPVNNTQKVDINVKKGVYTELVYVAPAKPFITVRGEDRDQTIVQYTNNDTLNVLPFTNTSDPNNQCINRRIPGTPDLWNCWRASFGVEANDFTLENITLHNTTPTGGSQAEAFRGNADRTTLNRVILQSFQDTTRVQGTVFVTNSYIEGDVDFTWGVGAVFFQQSQIHALRTGFYSMVRNDTNHGNVYINNRLTRAPTLGANTAGRLAAHTGGLPQPVPDQILGIQERRPDRRARQHEPAPGAVFAPDDGCRSCHMERSCIHIEWLGALHDQRDSRRSTRGANADSSQRGHRRQGELERAHRARPDGPDRIVQSRH